MKRCPDESNADYDWSTMDRDPDMAVFEFAPGSVLTKDKQRHLVVGFTGDLLPPERRGRDIQLAVASPWRESDHSVALCPHCGSAHYAVSQPADAVNCEDCGSEIAADVFQSYVTPAGFRTDFKPKHDPDIVSRLATRTVATVLHHGALAVAGNVRVRRGASDTIMQLNDGPDDGLGEVTRFTIVEAEDRAVPVPPTGATSEINAPQAIDAEFASTPAGVARWATIPNSRATLGLIAKKETDALYLEMLAFDMRSIVDNPSEWPLVDLLRADEEGEHASRCHTSCYRSVGRQPC
jgi:hypothetical protein